MQLWKQLEAQEGLFSQWTFPAECLQGDGTGDASLQLKGYVELLRNKVLEAGHVATGRKYLKDTQRTRGGYWM